MSANTIEIIKLGKLNRKKRWLYVTTSLFVIVLLLCCAMLLLGNTFYSPSVVLSVLMGEQIKGATFAIETIRLPRMLAALLTGFAFGISGYTFQTMLRNPLANPNVIGITSGSSAAAVFCIIVLHSSKAITSIASIVAGLLTVILIYVLAKGKVFSIGRLILVGIGIQAMCNAIITYLLLIGKEHDLPQAMRWLSGSLNGIKLTEIPLIAITTLVCVPVILLLSKQLSLLELGEFTAKSLGVKTDMTRIALIVSSVVLVAVATSITGPIASIAFLAGPIANRLVGSGGQNGLPSGLVGALLVLSADLLGQFAFVTKYPVGVITGIIGAPYLIFLLVRMNKRGEL